MENIKSRKNSKEEQGIIEAITKEDNDEETVKNEFIFVPSLNGKFIHVQVGNTKDPDVDNSEIQKVEDKIKSLLEKNSIRAAVLVTGCSVNITNIF